ncbi:MAG TPA: nuclear transport factor 2 family protein [Ohtaekwangia sp.]|uniref:nuclear transport factor 2 family protein n=1 Tax=Ohtaekwangia sp. TaxID=2066019 RepID=UPI002F94ACF6
MKYTFYTLVLVVVFHGEQVHSQSAAPVNDQVLAALKAYRSGYTQCMLEKKPDLLTSYYVDNVRLMPEFQKTVVGKDHALLYHKAFLSRFTVKEYTRKELEITDLGQQILEVGKFTTTATVNTTAKTYTWQGKYFTLWQKNGKTISLICEAWNYDHALEAEDLMHFSEVPVYDVALAPHEPVNNNIRFELAALNRLMEATVSQHDAGIWQQFYTDDGMFCYSRNPICQGKQALHDFLEKHCRDLVVFEKLDIRNDRIDHLGQYIVEYASHVAIWRGGDYSGVGLGKDLRIWRREPDGSLKIYRHIAMYD